MDDEIYNPSFLCPPNSGCGLCWKIREFRATADLGSHGHDWLYSFDMTYKLCMACGAVMSL